MVALFLATEVLIAETPGTYESPRADVAALRFSPAVALTLNWCLRLRARRPLTST